MNVQTVTKKVLPLFEKFKNEENLEFEMRFGKFNGSFFDTNVGQDNFNRLLDGLRRYNGWESVVEKSYESFYNDEHSVRLTVDDDTEEQVQIRKVKIHNEDFKRYKNTPHDIRFSFSKEIPIEGDFIMDRKRSKRRVSFVRKNLSIDLTESSGDTEDMDAEESVSYQVELEIIDPNKIENRDQLFNIIQKINDLFKLLPNNK
jgi:hypothetical protein